MPTRMLIHTLAVASLGLATLSSVHAQPAPGGAQPVMPAVRRTPPPAPPPPAPAPRADGERIVESRIVVRDDAGTIIITRSGDDLTVTKDGQPAEFERRGSNVIIIRPDGRPGRVFRLMPDGGIATGERGAPGAPGGMFGGAGGRGGFGGGWTAADIEAVEALRAYMPRTQIGITLGRVDDALAAQLGINPDEVVLVAVVRDGGPAHRAGLRRHDIITDIDGKSPVSMQLLREAVQSREPGQSLAIGLLREGQRVELEVEVEQFREDAARAFEAGRVADVVRELQARIGEESSFRVRSADVARELRDMSRRLAPEKMEQLRVAVEQELEQFREKLLDEQTWEQLRQSLELALENAMNVIERMDIEMRPMIEILREAEGRRGMIVRPEAPPPPSVYTVRPPEMRPARVDEIERRLERLEEQLARIEALLTRDR